MPVTASARDSGRGAVWFRKEQTTESGTAECLERFVS